MSSISQLSEDFIAAYDKNYRRYIFDDEVFTAPMVVVLGARGVGKTTLLVQKLLEYAPVNPRTRLFIPADHELMTGLSLYSVISQFYRLGTKVVCIDEIHKYPTWSKDLKSLRDEFRELKLIVSGSSALEISKTARDLSRRALFCHMYGLSFREFLELKLAKKIPLVTLQQLLNEHETIANDFKKLFSQALSREQLFEEYLRVGYYPYHLDFRQESLFWLTLTQSVAVTVESEIPAQHDKITASASRKFKKILSIIGTLPPFEFELKKLLQLTDISDERTLKIYLGYLEAAGLIVTLARKSAGLKAMRKPDKLYLDNPNLIYALTPHAAVNRGTLREIFFINCLRVRHQITLADQSDFVVDDRWTFEVGGPNKTTDQIRGIKHGYVVKDNIEIGRGNVVPLWLFGFLF